MACGELTGTGASNREKERWRMGKGKEDKGRNWKLHKEIKLKEEMIPMLPDRDVVPDLGET